MLVRVTGKRPEFQELFDLILTLRRLERRADPSFREDLAVVRETLEDMAGGTVKPADAARILHVSRPTMKKWLDRGEVASVTTPEGRREVPLPELLTLAEEISSTDPAGLERALARVIRERNRRAHDRIDPDRLLPRPRRRTHRLPELQSLAYHRAVADRLDDDLVSEARRRIVRWLREDRIDPRWAEEWLLILTKPTRDIARTISADTRRARELRQTSPFAGVLTEQERRRILEAVRQRST